MVRSVFLAHLWGFLGFFNNQRSLHTWNTKVVKEQELLLAKWEKSLIHTGQQRIGKEGKKYNQKEKCCKIFKAIHKHLQPSCQQQLHFQTRMTLPYSCCKNSAQSCALIVPGWKGLQMKPSVTTTAAQNPGFYCDIEVSDLYQQSD